MKLTEFVARQAKRKTAAKKAAQLTRPVRKAVSKLIDAKKEKKFTTGYQTQTFNSSIGNTGGPSGFSEFYSLIPAIPQGTAQNERIGDTVRPTWMNINVHLAATDDVSSFSGIVRLFILEDLTIADSTLQAVGLPNANLLLDAGGLQFPYSGGMDTHLLPVNKQRFRVLHDKLIKVQKGTGQQGNLANAYTGDNTCPIGSSHHQFRLKVNTRAVWKYDADTDQLPSNQAVWLALGYVNDNGVIDVANQRVQLSWTSTVYYTDE